MRWLGVMVTVSVLGWAASLMAQPVPTVIAEGGRMTATAFLSQAQPTFAVPFKPVRDGVYALAVQLNKPVAVTLRVTGKDRDPLEETGQEELSLEFEAQKGVPCTLTVALPPPWGRQW